MHCTFIQFNAIDTSPSNPIQYIYTSDRARHLSEGKKFAAQGDKEKANKSFQQAISITENMIYAVIKVLLVYIHHGWCILNY